MHGSPSPDHRREHRTRRAAAASAGAVPADADPAGERGAVIDPDVDLRSPAQRRENRPRRWELIAAIAVGGVLGAEARYGLSLALPHSDRQFPFSTVLINVTGCLLIGALMALLLELPAPHRLARPFLGVGVLGGYTTYSSFAVEVQRLLLHHRPLTALAYVAVTTFGCAGAVWLASALASRVIEALRRRRRMAAAELR